MQADFSIECGPGDECLEMPWASEDGLRRYVDLRLNPEALAALEEVRSFPEFGEFLATANAPLSVFQTAKCDAGFSREMTVEDEVFATTGKFWSYADFLFVAPEAQSSFAQHETAVRDLVRRLQLEPEMPVAAEFLVRRGFFAGGAEGFYITTYIFGYSDGEDEARRLWGMALRLVSAAFEKYSSELGTRVPE